MTSQPSPAPAWPSARRSSAKRLSRPHWPAVLIGAVLFVVGAYFLLPLFWLFVAATKTTGDLFSTFGLWFAPRFQLGENVQALVSYDGGVFGRWMLNSVLYSGVGALVSTLVAALAGYTLAKFSFPGRNLFFSSVLGANLVPSTALVLPLYLLMSRFGLTNTVWAVLLPSMVSPFGVYLARVYASASVPDELLDAARVDGSGELRTFMTIVLPILAPALVTMFLFQFVSIRNNFFLPLVMLSDPKLFPVTLGLQS